MNPELEVLRLAADASAARRAWPRWRDEIGALVGAGARIEHIGASAVPGALTKGDLDVLVIVPAAEFERVDAALARRFERNSGSDRTGTFSAFKQEAANPPLGVQLAAVGGSEAREFIGFRDRLTVDPSLLAAYNALKREWDGKLMEQYRAAKSKFIERTLRGG